MEKHKKMSNQPKPIAGQYGDWAKKHGVGVITLENFLNNNAKMIDPATAMPFQIQYGGNGVVVERSDPYGAEEGVVNLKSIREYFGFQPGINDTPEIEIRCTFVLGGLGFSHDGSMVNPTANAADFQKMYFETQAEGTVDGWVEFLSSNLYSESGVLVTREKAGAWIAGRGFVEKEPAMEDVEEVPAPAKSKKSPKE